MLVAAQISFWVLVALVISQGLLVIGFVAALRNWKRERLADQDAPKAAVILALRGGDPFLGECVRGLLAQDYPCYDVRVVIDHPTDPAGEIVQRIVEAENAEKVHVQFLSDPPDTCSLKCSSMVQAVRRLDESYQMVAQVDADTIPHATWLRELAAALADERVGAATGNRWYMPEKQSLGGLVRYLWNAAAVVQMYWYGIAWGGTLAVKTRVFRETDVLDRWSKAFCEDTMLLTVLRAAGLRVRFVPSLMMVNREDCDVGGYFRWVRRQLLTARLYHPAWPAVVGHGVLTTVGPATVAGLALLALATAEPWAAAWSIGGLVCYQVSVTLMLFPMEFAVRRIVRARGETTRWCQLGRLWKYLAAIPCTQLVYAAALVAASLLRIVDWRGVAYRIDGPWQVRLLKYQPFEPQGEQDSPVSL